MDGIKYERLNKIAQEIWKYCERRNIYVFASYINTKQNTIADFESRSLNYEIEYELSPKYLAKIRSIFKPPEIDLFASKLNTKCKIYVSWKPDPDSVSVDALLMSRRVYYFYIFPPFSIINKTIKKIINDRTTGVLIVPKWPGQPWYPIYQNLLTKNHYILALTRIYLCLLLASLTPYTNNLSWWQGGYQETCP